MRLRETLGIWAWIALVAACGPAAVPEAPAPTAMPADTPAAVPEAAPDSPYGRPELRRVPMPEAFQAAIARGTRTETGRPGPRMWQQRVDYRIDVSLEPAAALVQGSQVVAYHNNSPDTLDVLVFHLDQNLFSEGVPRTREVPITGGVTLQRVAVDGVEAGPMAGREAPPAGAVYQVEGALMYIRLPRPLPPAETSRVEFAWHFTVPPQGAPRTGHIRNRLFTVAQWYPRAAVYDDVIGWHTWPYQGNAEFYMPYGDFDVSITVPEGWLVAATGELQNPGEVLTDPVRERLGLAMRVDTVVHVVTEGDLGAGNATRQAPGGQLTWRFIASDVRDFAWATSDRYLWDAARAVVPGADGPRTTVPVHAFYRPEARTWREAATYTRHALQFHAERWHPYIYPQITSVEGPVGGMEYPMVSFVAAFPDARTLYTVINHEVAHQWWPMMVGHNEASYAWMDEGTGTYIENLATADFFPGADVWADDIQRYMAVAGSDAELEIMRHADLYGVYALFATAAYSKPAVLLRALGGVIGEETLHRALREYTSRWLLSHPYPWDFFNTVEDVAGRDLDWFWYPWWFQTAALDQAIADVQTRPVDGGEEVRITIDDRGGAPMPVDLALTLTNGETRNLRVPVDVWLTGARRHTETVTVPAPVQRIEIDPAQLFPDINRADNVWVRQAVRR